jgi:hypothetical protein
LAQYGCVSGLVSNLIYYRDTHAFYDRHYEEIEDLRCEYDGCGTRPFPYPLDGDLKNFFAWFAFEVTASRIWAEICGRL